MDIVINFYDKLFLYFYKLKKYDKTESSPQVFPMIVISAAQTGNIFFIVICFFYLFRIDFSYLPNFFLLVAIIIYAFNFYIYQIKNRKEIVLRKNMKLSLGFKVFTYLYFLLSYLSPLYLMYLFIEYGTRLWVLSARCLYRALATLNRDKKVPILEFAVIIRV